MTHEYDGDVPSLNRTAELWFADLDMKNPTSLARYALRLAALNGHSINSDMDLADLRDDLTLLAHLGIPEEAAAPGLREESYKLGRDIVRRTLHAADEEREKYELKVRAYSDPLTGLNNREGRQRWVQGRYSGGRRREELPPGKCTGVIEIDLVNFKRINDVLGHHIGDEALIEAASEIDESMRRNDEPVISRMGGDEFEVLLGTVSQRDFWQIVMRLHGRQLDKIKDGKNLRHWSRITQSIERADEQHLFPQIKVETSFIQGGQPIRMVTIAGESVAPLREITVLGLAGGVGRLSTRPAFDNMVRQLEVNAAYTKDALHHLMGGAYRNPND